MTKQLSDSTIATVKATVPALEQNGLAITRRMYERMFQNEAIRDLFNQSHHRASGDQPKALAQAVLAYARNIDNPGVLGEAIERIAQKHAALNILPEHYPFVATSLLGAIEDVLGDAATAPVLTAWGEAYWFLAEILIGREAAIYREAAERPGGWNGWREFVVESVRDESSVIRSFLLIPRDGGRVLRHRPGQYLGFAFDLPGTGGLRRNYSISCAPNTRAYRITVKREAEPGNPPGLASNWLHDHATPGTVLRVAAPAGEFFLDPTFPGPVVLVSGGVGLTPLLSMLAEIARATPDRPTAWIHAARDGGVHAMRGDLEELARRMSALRATIFYAAPRPQDQLGTNYDAQGLITAERLIAEAPSPEAHYYLCGPKLFLRSLVNGLIESGVDSARVRYEFFGPADDIIRPQASRPAA